MSLTRKQLDTILGHYCDKLPWGMQELVDEIRLLQSRLNAQENQIQAFATAAKDMRLDGWNAGLNAAARFVTAEVCMEIPCLHMACENDRILGRAIRALDYEEVEP